MDNEVLVIASYVVERKSINLILRCIGKLFLFKADIYYKVV